jgi:hypothetical protein
MDMVAPVDQAASPHYHRTEAESYSKSTRFLTDIPDGSYSTVPIDACRRNEVRRLSVGGPLFFESCEWVDVFLPRNISTES